MAIQTERKLAIKELLPGSHAINEEIIKGEFECPTCHNVSKTQIV